MTPKEHIEEIRRSKFSIGGATNPLTQDLHQAVKNLSAELYAKDVHFLMELIQNAEDNEYEEGVDPSLEFVITSKDITGTGAQATLVIFNTEKGFSRNNIDSICSVGRSTKKGNRKRGYIGEKGIGFKSVFLITARPYIFSNGYQIRFSEEPCQHCNVGYIVPEWVEANPTLSIIREIYGSSSPLPTTTIVLPLKSDKVKPVKQQLSSIHPEVLLFLSKIKKLSVREDNEDPRLNTVSAISISSEIDFVKKKNINAESYMLHLSADAKSGNMKECGYYMWKQKFPVRRDHRVERRMEVDEWVITLAFPNGERLNRGRASSPGIYAFLPTEMVTNFPFIIQADFLLASSRETILLDDTWNQGILDCVSSAFVSAFTSLVRSIEGAPVSSLTHMFGFLPVSESPYPILNRVRDSIKSKLLEESIIPCESYMEQIFFQKPNEVGRLIPAFWNLLDKARKQGVVLHNISSHGRFIINSAFDREMYNHILNFLEVKKVDNEWYAKCIQSSNLVLGVSEDIYLEMLSFVADKWTSFKTTEMVNIQLLKYVDFDDDVSLSSICEALNDDHSLLLSHEFGDISWLISWNSEFHFANHLFFAKSTQEAVRSHHKRQTILDWLKDEVNVSIVKVYNYALLILKSLGDDRKLVVAFTHFLHQSLRRNYLSSDQVATLCCEMPLVDNYGLVTRERKGVLVPANGSKWVQLIGANPWRYQGYVELGEDYLHSGSYAGVSTSKKELLAFLKRYVAAMDIPDLPPPDAVISSMSSPLTRENALLMLEWISKMKMNGFTLPRRFLNCIREGSWLRVSLNGNPGYRPPSQSFFHTSSWGHLLQNGSVLVDIPLVDQGFYGGELKQYKEELTTAGVMFEFKEACEYIGEHFMNLATTSTLTKGHVISILTFIKYLREKYLSPDTFINSINNTRWLQTTQREKKPTESVFFDREWNAASQISDIPFIDQKHYGDEILSFKTELKLLGVVFGFNQNYQLVVDNLRSSACLGCLSSDGLLLLLKCINHLKSSDKICRALRDNKCIKTTNMGYRSPSECFLPDPVWGCLLQVFGSFPLIDTSFYGSSVMSYKSELQKLGVVVNFEEATKAFAAIFRQQTSQGALNKDSALSLLGCYRKLKTTSFKFPSDLKSCIQEAKWLRTRIRVDKVPKDCILFGSGWESISSISLLPFIDDSEARYGRIIHEYKDELHSMGVTVSFASGAKFVPASLRLPDDPSAITGPVAFSLLECMRNLEHNGDLLDTLRSKLARKWMKTNVGYGSPDKCLLFGSHWNAILKPEDGPFIDEKFYGSKIGSYKKELKSLGVVVEIGDGCSLLANHLDCHSSSITITRIYKYLSKFNWRPTKKDPNKVWIPNGDNDGEWIKPDDCVLHDKSGFFGLQLHVLEKYYDKELLSFFSELGIKSNPSLDDYHKLWKSWEGAGRNLSLDQCQTFWEFIVKHWTSRTEKFLSENLSKLPAGSGSDEILLLDKRDVFIADDLYLKDLFEQSSSHPLFVWYPQPSLPSLPRQKLLEVYSKIGVRTLSESVVWKDFSCVNCVGLEQVQPNEMFIGRGLFKLILGFLADPSFEMEAHKRHETLKCLTDVSIFVTSEPITTNCSLSLTCGEVVNVKVSRMMSWERENSKLFIQKLDKEGGYKSKLEYATYFSEVVAEGILREKEDYVNQLAELVKLGFILEFDEAAVSFLMKTKNLQIYLEDEEFLSSVFTSK